MGRRGEELHTVFLAAIFKTQILLNKYENMTYSENNTEFMYDDIFICREIFNFPTKAGKLCFFSYTSPSPSNKKLYYSNPNRTCNIIL